MGSIINMTISLIAALDKNRLIGSGQKIPWHLPADLAYFKHTTLGHPIIMGRTTFESIGRPLPGRRNIVLTRGEYAAEGVEIAHSLDEMCTLVQGEDEVFVIGGAQVYAATLSLADRLYLTFVDGEFSGDTFFPSIDQHQWKEIKSEEREADAQNPYPMKFVVFERIR